MAGGKNDEEPVFVDPPNLSNATSHTSVSKDNLFDKLFYRVKQIFSNPHTDSKVLAGRINQMRDTFASTYESVLSALQKCQEKNDDKSLLGVLVFSTIAKDGDKLQQQFYKNGIEHVKLIAAFGRWVECANGWLDRFQTCESAELTQEAFKQVVQDNAVRINKDLQLITEYTQQQIEMMNLRDGEQEQVRKKLDAELRVYRDELEHLTTAIPMITINELPAWRAEVNKKRETYFNAALSVIDRIIVESSTLSSEEEHHHLVDILKAIKLIEERLPAISDILKQDDVIIDARLAVASQVTLLKDQAHKLSLDLRLTQQLQDRLLEIIDSLEEAESLLRNNR